jgi:hypothetical protein
MMLGPRDRRHRRHIPTSVAAVWRFCRSNSPRADRHFDGYMEQNENSSDLLWQGLSVISDILLVSKGGGERSQQMHKKQMWPEGSLNAVAAVEGQPHARWIPTSSTRF